jgi:hypothetical protein
MTSAEVCYAHFAASGRSLLKLAFAVVALLVMRSYGSAEPILSVTDSAPVVNRGGLFLGGEFGNAVAVSWTQTDAFSGLTIQASIGSAINSFTTATAYLTDAIGPGQTVAAEVLAPVNLAVPVGDTFGPLPLTTIFSDIDLGPGTYYLILTAPPGTEPLFTGSPMVWQIASQPVISTISSLHFDGTSIALGSNVNSFIPASSFVTDPRDLPIFQVTTPEPKPVTLMLIVLVSLAAVKLSKSQFLKRRPTGGANMVS